MDSNRSRARELAKKHLAAGDAVGWFEPLYADAGGDPAAIPWADLKPNPNLVQWLDAARTKNFGKTGLVVGCGLGDDAEELARRGLQVTAFDVSATAIAWCRRRFPASAVTYAAADLLKPPDAWRGAFEFVFEANTLQALPPALRRRAMEPLAALVAPGGTLLLIARGRDPQDPLGEMPWPLARDELAVLESAGLTCDSFEDYLDAEDPPVRRFRVAYRRGTEHKALT